MRLLTLVRHAVAGWPQSAGRDFDRPLTPQGESDATAMGARLVSEGFAPDRMLCSPAERAYRTCELLAAEIGFPHMRVEVIEPLYGASLQELLTVVRATDPACRHLALVAHNPGIGKLANRLGASLGSGMGPCSVVRFELSVDSWDEAGSETASFLSFDRPDGDRGA